MVSTGTQLGAETRTSARTRRTVDGELHERARADSRVAAEQRIEERCVSRSIGFVAHVNVRPRVAGFLVEEVVRIAVAGRRRMKTAPCQRHEIADSFANFFRRLQVDAVEGLDGVEVRRKTRVGATCPRIEMNQIEVTDRRCHAPVVDLHDARACVTRRGEQVGGRDVVVGRGAVLRRTLGERQRKRIEVSP
jgi:hypothetical protein